MSEEITYWFSKYNKASRFGQQKASLSFVFIKNICKWIFFCLLCRSHNRKHCNKRSKAYSCWSRKVGKNSTKLLSPGAVPYHETLKRNSI